MNNYEKMLKGELYLASGDEIESRALRCKEFLDKFMETSYKDYETREKLCRNLFKKVGKNFTINKPFYCDYGCNISIGDNFYANANCCFLDVNEIIIGNNVFIGPNVNLYTAAHPLTFKARNSGLEYGKKIIIGNNVWLGGSVVINPGIKINDNVVVGSGSVVTHDLPSNTICAGNPCKVLREITLDDEEFWDLKCKNYSL